MTDERAGLILRLGFYSARAIRDLEDYSYLNRFFGRVQEATDADCREVVAEIHHRLVKAGRLEPGEDPYASEMQAYRKPTGNAEA